MTISRLIPKPIKKRLIRTIYSATRPYEIRMSNEPELHDKIAVVTGGSGAIGRAICFQLGVMGAVVYVCSRTQESAMKVVEEMRDHDLRAEPLVLNVRDESSVEVAFEEVKKNAGRLDILINCAGGGARGSMSMLSEQNIGVIDEVLDTNLRGTILCTRKAAQIMIPNKQGKIVIISSAVGVQGKAKYSEYAAAKSGMIGFMKSMALELGFYNINVNCITPGFIQRGEYDDSQLEYLKKSNALHKVGTMEDVACAVTFMASDKAGFITGQNLCVDGGRTLGLMGD